ncbi:MAG: hypothetical protein WBX27_07570 [Specibacter sp.]
MSKHPERDADPSGDTSARDPLAEVYTELVTPDIAEINDHAATLAEESETEPENL